MKRYAGLGVAASCLMLLGCSGQIGGSPAPAGGTASAAPPPASSPILTPAPGSPAATPPGSPVTGTPGAPGGSPPAGAPVPVLGQARGVTRGYGSARPRVLDNGGDPTGILTNVSWRSWGGREAVGTGTGYYDPPGKPIAESVSERATVVAFDLGNCGGRSTYQAVEWYFPSSGGTFDPNNYLDVCSWTYHPASR